MTETVRIFVAATPAEWLPMRVLEFSIKENTHSDVDLRALYTFDRQYGVPKERRNRPRTPFSFQRFLIPEICGFAGRAIYMDADMQVFKDIRGLWSVPLEGNSIQTVRPADDGRKGQFSVMLLDCAVLDWNIDEIVTSLDRGDLTYEQLMYDMRVAPSIGKSISSNWNCLERFDQSTCLLHYTDMDTQPWVSLGNPLGALWIQVLERAVKAGFISLTEVRREVDAGHVRPSLLNQLELGVVDAQQLPKSVKALDAGFVPPYKGLNAVNASPWISPVGFLRAMVREIWIRSKKLRALVRP